MATFRSAAAVTRACWAGLVALALLVRLAVPAGWMPIAGPDGVRVGLCSGMAASTDAPARTTVIPLRRAPSHDHPAPERPCDFAVAALALTTPAPPAFVTPALPIPAPASAKPPSVAIGHGLAAPPPPATGPPLLG